MIHFLEFVVWNLEYFSKPLISHLLSCLNPPDLYLLEMELFTAMLSSTPPERDSKLDLRKCSRRPTMSTFSVLNRGERRFKY